MKGGMFMNLQKYTQNSIHALERARDVAQEHQHQMIQPLHVFYGLLSDSEGLVSGLLARDRLLRRKNGFVADGCHPCNDPVFICPKS